MKILTGQALHEQIAIGRLHFLHRQPPVLRQYSQKSWQDEDERYLWARKNSVLQLAALYDRALGEVGEETASIFAIHAMLLEDGDLGRRTRKMIREEGVTAEFATKTVGDQVAEVFAQMDSEYMRQRSVDFQDITRRMVLWLLNTGAPKSQSKEPVILVAEKFLPSEVMELDRRKMLGLISSRDGVTSHTALLLKAYGIAAMVDVDMDPAWEGRLSLMDGFAQKLYLDPEDSVMEELRLNYQEGGKPRQVEENIV